MLIFIFNDTPSMGFEGFYLEYISRWFQLLYFRFKVTIR